MSNPDPLADALEHMEACIRSLMYNLGFAAPEMHPLLWGMLREQLTDIMTKLYEENHP
jgi:hypothetical protein